MLSQKIASWPSVTSVASRIGSRHTGQITEQSSVEYVGEFSSSEKDGGFSKLESTVSCELDGKVFFRTFFFDFEVRTGMVTAAFVEIVVHSSN